MYEQLDIFDITLPKLQIRKPIRLIELFAGIGSQAMALRDLGADFKHYRVVEFDRFAIASYNAIHGTDFPPMDITKIRGADLGVVDTDKYCYIMTYSFPCQDLSVAGKQKGMKKGSGTRSGLLWEVERILNEVENLPEVLLMENVPPVHSQANMPDFQKWIDFLESKGYSNYWQDLNAKDYRVAQNRNRCFMVSILGEWNFKFPKPVPLTKTIKDHLEDEVDEKYFINSGKKRKLIQQLIDNGTLSEGTGYANYNTFEKYSDIAKCMQSRDYKGLGGNVQTQNVVIDKIPIDLSINEPKEKAISNCIMEGDNGISNKQSSGNGVIECQNLKTEEALNTMPDGTCRTIKSQYAKNGIDNFVNQSSFGATGVIVAMCGRNSDNPSDRIAGSPTEQRLEPNSQGICNTLTSVQKNNMVLENQYRIRKLTPLECWRLMGFSDEDFHKAEKVNSNSQLYKQNGNSIVKNVLIAIFGQMIPGKENVYREN